MRFALSQIRVGDSKPQACARHEIPGVSLRVIKPKLACRAVALKLCADLFSPKTSRQAFRRYTHPVQKKEHRMSLTLSLLGAALMTTAADTAPQYALTIYSSAQGAMDAEMLSDGNSVPGYALVSDTREMVFPNGRGELRFTDVAQRIDPTTVSFASLTDPAGTRVLEQNYQFDLVSQAKLLNRYIGAQIIVTQSAGNERVTHTGTLLGARDGLLMQTDSGGVLALNNYDSFAFASLPGGLITKPTLVWLVDAQKAGAHQARVAYQTKGMTWWADYNVILNADEAKPKMDLSAWVTVVNQSGGSFPQAKLKLVAGDVNRAPAAAQPVDRGMVLMKSASMDAVEEGFQESALFEYHLYTLGRRSDVPDNSAKQLELFPGKTNVPARRQLVFTAPGFQSNMYYGGANTDQNLGTFAKGEVNAYLEFDNKEAAGLGMPLPKGRVRVSQAGPDGALEFIGEDAIAHTPKNETLRLKLGQAFDVVGDRTRSDFQVDSNAKTMTETFKISVRNRKKTAVNVLIREYMYRWSGWEIVTSSVKSDKKDAQTVDFPVEIAADGTALLTYTVKYRW
jgi:hypothetical protein